MAWSQILYVTEVVMALNTHGVEARGAFVTVDHALHEPGSTMTVLYRSDWEEAQLHHPPQDEVLPVQSHQGRRVVRVNLPPAGMVILA
jgi:hypothetical protein